MSPPPSVAWRALPLEPRAGPDLFFSAARDVDDGGDGEAWTQFCEESLACLDESSASQLDDDSLACDETSFMTTTTDASAADQPPLPPLPLSTLADVPSARRLAALQPQTVSLNLVVGVLSVARPRRVTTRWGRDVELVELLVGDPSAAGFAVSFWLSGPAAAAECPVLALRRQDVVLLQNVALHVFRGKVYGQSLRRGLTRVLLLWRAGGGGRYSTGRLDRDGDDDEPAPHPCQHRARLARDWVLHFVGRDPAAAARRPRKSWDRPPDDTQ
ncbi:hypothetical protein CDD83_3983 [Cordyceps sp. RAO-2017]|nr:hypothetical protein CDD83_3983 [Cordyceps sp. RAO-2017]